MVTGIVDWNAIAPVMLPTARTSLPWRIHTTVLAFSGSSVASGARIRATINAERPRSSAIVSTPPTNSSVPRMIAPRETRNCAVICAVFGGSCLLRSKYSGRSLLLLGVAAGPIVRTV